MRSPTATSFARARQNARASASVSDAMNEIDAPSRTQASSTSASRRSAEAAEAASIVTTPCTGLA
jgi:hypothetical protein